MPITSSITPVVLTSLADTWAAADSRDYAVFGLTGNDTITSGSGHDLVHGGSGNDVLSTGAGDDLILVSGTLEGTDSVNGGIGADRLEATENGTILRVSALTGVEAISGGGYAGVQLHMTGLDDGLDLSGATLTGITAIDLGVGNDTFTGSGGADTVIGGRGDDDLSGGGGDDVFVLRRYAGLDAIDGGGGSDTVRADEAGAAVYWESLTGVEAIEATAADVSLLGTSGDDTISHAAIAWSGLDLVDGGRGNDTLEGGGADDALLGGRERDRLTGNGGADDFVYRSVADSRTNGMLDTITDFLSGTDEIDLTAIDANVLSGAAGDQAFTWIGTDSFSGVAGELRYGFNGSTVTRVEVDINGNGLADMVVRLTGNVVLTADDFLL